MRIPVVLNLKNKETKPELFGINEKSIYCSKSNFVN